MLEYFSSNRAGFTEIILFWLLIAENFLSESKSIYFYVNSFMIIKCESKNFYTLIMIAGGND